jgi:hypothetical protein
MKSQSSKLKLLVEANLRKLRAYREQSTSLARTGEPSNGSQRSRGAGDRTLLQVGQAGPNQ